MKVKQASTVKLFVLGVSAVAVIVAWIAFSPLSLLESPETNGPSPRTTAEVGVASLTATFDADGTMAPAAQWDLQSSRSGTITAISVAGSTLSTGVEIAAIDAQPIVAIIGPVPAWRSMTVDDEGADVLALEEALVALGYDPTESLSVDGYFTSYTAALVELWQADQGRPVTGSVEFGDVIIVPEGTQISTVSGESGQPANGSLMRLSSPSRTVSFEVDSEQRASLAVGDMVEVRYQDRTTEETVVQTIGSTGTGAWLVTTSALTSTSAVSTETAEVDVLWDIELGTDLVVVNGSALLRLDNGGYVLEVVGADDRNTEFVAVELGARSGSTVEVSGVEPGTLIVVP